MTADIRTVRQRWVWRLLWPLLVVFFALVVLVGGYESRVGEIVLGVAGVVATGVLAYGAWHARVLVGPDAVCKRYLAKWGRPMRFDEVTSMASSGNGWGLMVLATDSPSPTLFVPGAFFPLRPTSRALASRFRSVDDPAPWVMVRQRLLMRWGCVLVGLPFFLGLIAGLVEGSALGIFVGLPGTAVMGVFVYGAWHARLLVEPDRVRKRYVRGWQPAMRFDDVIGVDLEAVARVGLLLGLLSTSRAVLSVDQPSWPIRRVCRVLAPHLLARRGSIQITDTFGTLRRALERETISS